jgi:transposase-like protein
VHPYIRRRTSIVSGQYTCRRGIIDNVARDAASHRLPNYSSCSALVTKAHRTLNAEIERRTDVVGIFPNDAPITRLAGALLPVRQNRQRHSSGSSDPPGLYAAFSIQRQLTT